MSASNRLSQKSNGGEVVSDFNYETRRKNSHRQVWLPGIALMQACEKFFWQTDSADRKYLRVSQIVTTTFFSGILPVSMQKIIHKRRRTKANSAPPGLTSKMGKGG
ncbi:uncharacterized protein Aud_003701 [Aspergillus udagawae]|uniref:Uncharacterized protein n=1 Tax=Aspergillus udagawae TaxID=91492 RepID=A0A8E0QL58_9EURO|nr:uncharacterized protein Aud_003701 [Aspergillus udagawae]GIC87317.1 hypothetical protein Aud_003701 [Aspergillus udagawae]